MANILLGSYCPFYLFNNETYFFYFFFISNNRYINVSHLVDQPLYNKYIIQCLTVPLNLTGKSTLRT